MKGSKAHRKCVQRARRLAEKVGRTRRSKRLKLNAALLSSACWSALYGLDTKVRRKYNDNTDLNCHPSYIINDYYYRMFNNR